MFAACVRAFHASSATAPLPSSSPSHHSAARLLTHLFSLGLPEVTSSLSGCEVRMFGLQSSGKTTLISDLTNVHLPVSAHQSTRSIVRLIPVPRSPAPNETRYTLAFPRFTAAAIPLFHSNSDEAVSEHLRAFWDAHLTDNSLNSSTGVKARVSIDPRYTAEITVRDPGATPLVFVDMPGKTANTLEAASAQADWYELLKATTPGAGPGAAARSRVLAVVVVNPAASDKNVGQILADPIVTDVVKDIGLNGHSWERVQFVVASTHMDKLSAQYVPTLLEHASDLVRQAKRSNVAMTIAYRSVLAPGQQQQGRDELSVLEDLGITTDGNASLCGKAALLEHLFDKVLRGINTDAILDSLRRSERDLKASLAGQFVDVLKETKGMYETDWRQRAAAEIVLDIRKDFVQYLRDTLPPDLDDMLAATTTSGSGSSDPAALRTEDVLAKQREIAGKITDVITEWTPDLPRDIVAAVSDKMLEHHAKMNRSKGSLRVKQLLDGEVANYFACFKMDQLEKRIAASAETFASSIFVPLEEPTDFVQEIGKRFCDRLVADVVDTLDGVYSHCLKFAWTQSPHTTPAVTANIELWNKQLKDVELAKAVVQRLYEHQGRSTSLGRSSSARSRKAASPGPTDTPKSISRGTDEMNKFYIGVAIFALAGAIIDLYRRLHRSVKESVVEATSETRVVVPLLDQDNKPTTDAVPTSFVARMATRLAAMQSMVEASSAAVVSGAVYFLAWLVGLA